MHNDEALISVSGVSKKYCRHLRSSLFYGVQDITRELLFGIGAEESARKLRKKEFWALKDVSFELRCGESLAIIGNNGSGKSTLLKLLYGLIRPDTGRIKIKGRVNAIIELQAGLDPILSGRENIYNKATLFGLSRRQIENVIDEIIDFSELRQFIDTPVGFYSSGMTARLGFSIAAQLKPDILLIDEVLAVGDYNFRRKCLARLLEFTSNGGSVIFVSHDPKQIQTICQKALLFDQGEIVYSGDVVDTLHFYFQQNQKQEKSEAAFQELPLLSKENPLIIDTVLISSEQGVEIKTGDDVRITITYRCFETMENSGWYFSIWTNDDMTCLAGSVLMPVTFEKGSGELSCVVPAFNLAGGNYLLKAGAGFNDTIMFPSATFGLQNLPTSFSVTAITDSLAMLRLKQKQLTVMDVKRHF